MTAPCKDCERRRTGDAAGCHAGCEAYQEWKRGRDRIIEAREKEQATWAERPRKVRRWLWREMKQKNGR